jgi:carboxyl-terminal processing protease
MAAVALAAFFTGGWFWTGVRSAEADRFQQARLFERVLNLVRDYYVDSLPEPELYRDAAYGLVAGLNDPYSALLLEDDLERAEERTTGDYGGIGARIDVRNGWVTVVATLPDTPAERAGIRTGDRIVAVEGESTHGWSVDRAVNTLRGEVGTRVAVGVSRVGHEELFEVSLRRSRVHQRSVAGAVTLADGVGYVSVDVVRARSASELGTEVGQLYAKGIRELIIDLRGNPGGVRDEAVLAAELFLDPQDHILVTRGRTEADNILFVDSMPQPWPDLSIVVLVNGGSISAAEILAGALQDHDRALIVGQTTFGKGLVQTQFHFSEGAALRITTARWFTPSGRSIQRASVDIPHGDAVDTTVAPVYFSSAGRKLYGGGGIRPDVAVTLDTLSDGERRLVEVLEPHFSQYRDAIAAVAFDVKRGGMVTDESFMVSQAQLEELRRQLAAREISVPDSVWEGGRTLVESHLGYEIARYQFGNSAELKRRLGDDGQVRRAVELLRMSESREDLFELAGTPLPSERQG